MLDITPLTFFLILVSPAVGSFVAVLVDRLPREEDVVSKRSACRDCGTTLRPVHMVPLVSFVVQGGQCRTCHRAIPPWLFYVELLSLGAAVLAVIAGASPAHILLSAMALWLLIGLATADLIWFRLPDILTASLAAVAFGLAITPGGIGLYHATLGAFFGAGSFAALRVSYAFLRGKEGLGLGDVKLMIGLGAFVGPFDLPLLVLFGALIGLGFALVSRVWDTSALDRERAIPFGTALSAAALMLWLVN